MKTKGIVVIVQPKKTSRAYLIRQRTVAAKIRRWYPLAHQRSSLAVNKLAEHMGRCRVCGDPFDGLCKEASEMVVHADQVLGLREK